MSYHEIVADATTLFDYFETHSFALGGLPPKSKAPYEDKAYHPSVFHSRLRADWERWRGNGMNLALPGKPNNLLLIDIDVSAVGIKPAWDAYFALLEKLGVVAPREPGDAYWPQTTSPSGGWHTYVRLPAALPHNICDYRIPVKISHVRPLTDEEKRKKNGGDSEVIGVRYGMYCVAPSSFFDGTAEAKISGPYTLTNAAAPYD